MQFVGGFWTSMKLQKRTLEVQTHKDPELFRASTAFEFQADTILVTVPLRRVGIALKTLNAPRPALGSG